MPLRFRLIRRLKRNEYQRLDVPTLVGMPLFHKVKALENVARKQNAVPMERFFRTVRASLAYESGETTTSPIPAIHLASGATEGDVQKWTFDSGNLLFRTVTEGNARMASPRRSFLTMRLSVFSSCPLSPATRLTLIDHSGCDKTSYPVSPAFGGLLNNLSYPVVCLSITRVRIRYLDLTD